MSLAFLCKKSWHTSNLKNVEQVWIAEQKAEAEKKKLGELRKQIEEERQVQELRELQAKTNIGGSKAIRKVDFLYEGPMAQATSTEEYLMGKSYKDTGEVNEVNELESKQTAGSLFLNKAANTANEQFRRIHEDPMLEIRRKQKAAKEHILKNPVKMGKIKKALEDKKLKKMLKKERKSEKKAKKKALKKEKKKKEKDRGGRSNDEDSDSQSPPHKRMSSRASSPPRREGGRGRMDNRPAWMTNPTKEDREAIRNADKKAMGSDSGRGNGRRSKSPNGRDQRRRSPSRSPIRPRQRERLERRDRSRSPAGNRKRRRDSRSRTPPRKRTERSRSRRRSRSRSRSPRQRRRRRSRSSSSSRSRSRSPQRSMANGKQSSPQQNGEGHNFAKRKGYGLQGGKTSTSSSGTGLDEAMMRKRRELIEAEKREAAAKLARTERKPMTEEERLQKLKEFSSDASINDELRMKRLRKAHVNEKLEERLNEARRARTMQNSKETNGPGAKTPAFLKQMEGEALGGESMAERVKRNRHYQQRGHDASTSFNVRD